MFKRILFCLTALAITAASFAQTSTKMPLVAGDTIVNTGTSSKILQVTTAPAGVVLHVVLNKISGTGAGTVQLQQSLDGVNYVNLGSAFTITNVTTQSTVFTVAAPVPQWIKILSTGSGTESVQQVIWYRAPKYQTQQY